MRTCRHDGSVLEQLSLEGGALLFALRLLQLFLQNLDFIFLILLQELIRLVKFVFV
jgi:hypothetical protein